MQSERATKVLFLLLSLCLGCSSITSYGAATELHLSLFQAIDQRLAYMEDVALYKAQNRIPIEDIAREEAVLADAKNLAANHGLDPQSMERFFQAQIDAAKAIQYRYRAELLSRDLPEQAIDLQQDIRPALDRLGREIVDLFAAVIVRHWAIDEESRKLFMDTLQRRLLSTADKEALFRAMQEVRSSQ